MMNKLKVIVLIGLMALAVKGVFAASQSFGGLSLTAVTPRIITPNGDSRNDVIFFKFDDTLAGLPIDSAIFDINGAKISGLRTDSLETSLIWDGRNDQGQVVPSGIYIYSIRIGKRRASGSVVVAR